jgi:hypothetical protein
MRSLFALHHWVTPSFPAKNLQRTLQRTCKEPCKEPCKESAKNPAKNLLLLRKFAAKPIDATLNPSPVPRIGPCNLRADGS